MSVVSTSTSTKVAGSASGTHAISHLMSVAAPSSTSVAGAASEATSEAPAPSAAAAAASEGVDEEYDTLSASSSDYAPERCARRQLESVDGARPFSDAFRLRSDTESVQSLYQGVLNALGPLVPLTSSAARMQQGTVEAGDDYHEEETSCGPWPQRRSRRYGRGRSLLRQLQAMGDIAAVSGADVTAC